VVLRVQRLPRFANIDHQLSVFDALLIGFATPVRYDQLGRQLRSVLGC
jgi:hypothetical protein